MKVLNFGIGHQIGNLATLETKIFMLAMTSNEIEQHFLL